MAAEAAVPGGEIFSPARKRAVDRDDRANASSEFQQVIIASPRALRGLPWIPSSPVLSCRSRL
jgi:hypothetical protein